MVGHRFFRDAEFSGDLGVGEVLEEEWFDFVALGGGAVLGAAGSGELALALEEGGDLDFVAVEEAGGDEGDDVVPSVV